MPEKSTSFQWLRHRSIRQSCQPVSGVSPCVIEQGLPCQIPLQLPARRIIRPAGQHRSAPPAAGQPHAGCCDRSRSLLQAWRQGIEQAGVRPKRFAEQAGGFVTGRVHGKTLGELQQQLFPFGALVTTSSQQSAPDGQSGLRCGLLLFQAGQPCRSISQFCETEGQQLTLVLIRCAVAGGITSSAKPLCAAGPLHTPAG